MNLYEIETTAQFNDVPKYVWADNFSHAEEIIKTNFNTKILQIKLITKKSNIYSE